MNGTKLSQVSDWHSSVGNGDVRVMGEFGCSTWLVHASERMPHARAVAPAVHLDLHMLTSSRTEARKQAQAEEEYYNTFEHQQGDSEQSYDSTVSAPPPDLPAPEPFSFSDNRTLRSASQPNDLNTLIARIAAKRRGSDDSLKTVYAADETIPTSAYRSRPDLSFPHTNITAPTPTDNSLDEEDLISTFTDY